MKLKFNRKVFESIVYILVIITGASALIFHFTHNDAIGWILITLGVLNLGATLLGKQKLRK